MRNLIGYLPGVLIVTLFAISPIGTAHTQEADKALDSDGSEENADHGSDEDISTKPDDAPQRLKKPLYDIEPSPVHQWIALQAYLKLSSSGLKNELAEYLPTDVSSYYYKGDDQGNPFDSPDGWNNDDDAPYVQFTALIEGVWEEDKGGETVLWPFDTAIPWRSFAHFWNPDGDYDAGLDLSFMKLEGVGVQQSALEAAQDRFSQAVAHYNIGEKTQAYYWLGRTAHLLMDLSVPAHVQLDPHVPQVSDEDNYEAFTASWEFHYKHITSSSAFTSQPSPPYTDYPRAADTPSWFNDDLTDLLYTLANFADQFDSDDKEGDSDTYGKGKYNRASNAIMANKTFDKAYKLNRLKQETRLLSSPADYVVVNCSWSQDASIIYSSSFYSELNLTEWVRVYYTDGTREDFLIQDENDVPWAVCGEIFQPQLQARAIGYTAALYQLFWDIVNPQREGDCLSLNDYNWDDDSDGDDDGVMEAGEKICLKIQLHSTSNIQNVDAVLRTSDPKVIITDSTVDYDPFYAGAEQWSVGCFDMNLNFELPEDQTRISNFTLHLTYEKEGLEYYQDISFSKMFYWQGEHVRFEISDYTIDDSKSICHRNKEDHVFQSSEYIHIRPLLCNNGIANTTQIDVSLLYDGEVLEVAPGDERYPDLAPDASGYPKEGRYFRVGSKDYSFTGRVNLDVQVICPERTTPQVIENAIQLHVEPAPVLSVSPKEYDFGTTRPGKDVVTSVCVSNIGSGVMTVNDVQTSHDDTVVPEADTSFTLEPSSCRDIRITIHTGGISSCTDIEREVQVISDNTRISSITSDKMIIEGSVCDTLPIYQVPRVTQAGSQPDISGSWIVWEDSRNVNSDIYAYNICTGTEQQITTNPGRQISARIGGSLIAWNDNRNWDGAGDVSLDIYGYDLNTGQEFVISDDPADERLIGVDNGKVAFTRVYHVLTENGREISNLWLYDQSTGVATNETKFTSNTSHSPMHSVDEENADFGGGLLVWSETTMYWETQYDRWGSTVARVRKMNIGVDSDPVEVLTGSYHSLSANAGRFVWVRDVNGNAQVWIWDNGSPPRQVTNEETNHGEDILAIGNDFIVYDKDSGAGLFYWDLNENREFPLTDELPFSEAVRMDINRPVSHSLVDSEWHIYHASLDGSFPDCCPQLTIDSGSLSPANGSSGSKQVTFDWEAVSNTAGYAFQIDTVDVAFNHLWCDEVVYESPVIKTIPPVDAIYWRVKALAPGVCSDGFWTSPLVYELRLEPPSNLQAFDTPDDQGHSVTLTWTKSPDDGAGLNIVSYYRIYRSRSSELTAPIPISAFPWSACPDTIEFFPGSCAGLDSLMVMELTHTILIDSVAAGTTEYVDLFVPVTGVPYTYWLDAVAANGGMSAKIVARFVQTDVGEEATVSLPQKYLLYQNFPNPFNPTTTIRYQLPEISEVRLSIYNLLGQEIRRLVDREMEAGTHSALWDGRDDSERPLASGVYLCRFRAGDFTQTKRIVLLK